jgi:hypothetical protein
MAMTRDIKSYSITPEQSRLIQKRCEPLLTHWGRFIGVHSLNDLIFSCYAQGMLDCEEALRYSRISKAVPSPDFQI